MKILNTVMRTHPMHTVRAAELLRWQRAGGYDKIIAGDYIRRGSGDKDHPLGEDYADAAGYYGQKTRETVESVQGRVQQRAATRSARRGGIADGASRGRRRARTRARLAPAPGKSVDRDSRRARQSGHRRDRDVRADVRATDVAALVALARQERVDWTLVGPEAPLAAGHRRRVSRRVDCRSSDPTRAAAAIETSKAFAKDAHGRSRRADGARASRAASLADANRAIDELADDAQRVVIKASGLAAGKGVIVCDDASTKRDAPPRRCSSDRAFGDAGDTVLVEEFMEGEELSLFALTDGERVVTLPASQDHKRLLDGDRGPNTGGMGAYCPVSLADAPGFTDDVVDRIVRPTLAAMRARGTPFTGLLYVGLMLTADGPKVVEFNCRFGDPETQAVLPALAADANVFEAMCDGRARRTPLGTTPIAARRARP